LFDYPTINVLANYLFSEVLEKTNGKQSSTASESKTQSADLNELNIEELSDAEAEALLLAELDNKGAKK
jgi:hypothetical protein